MPLKIAERAAERPAEVALRDDRVALTWPEVDDLVNRAANALRALDLGPKRRVAVYAENAAETVIAHLGALFAGASSVPVNFHFTAEEVEFILSDSGAAVVLVGPETVGRAAVAARAAGTPHVIAWRSEPAEGVTPWEQALAGASPASPPIDVPPLPNLMYTSGTTGRPKGVDLPPTMFAAGKDLREHVEALEKNRFCQFGTHIVIGPMYHTGPLSGVRVLAAGTPVLVLGRFDAETVLQAIDTYKTETSIMVPTHFVRLLALPEEVKARYDVSSMQVVGHTGAACPVDVKRAMIEWWGPIFFDAYGATEVGTICTITSPEWLEHPGSVGRCIPPFARAVVVDDDGNEVPPGTEGRLYFEDSTGRGIVYPSDPAKTEASHLRPGVFTIGEIGYVTEDGFVYITDRFSDMIVSGGANIYPAEAEKVLLTHPGVADVAVIGVPNAEMGEEVKALVVPVDPANPPDPAELIGFCRQHLSGYKCPRTLDIVDSVGRNAMGKINKRQLRAPFWETGRTIGG